MIDIKDLKHSYKSKKGGTVEALRGITCSFAESGMYFLTGKSGCGKSTLLNILGGLDMVQSGDMLVDGESVKDYSAANFDDYRGNYAGVIFQEFNLIESLTVFDNLNLALTLLGKKDNGAAISRTLKKVGLEGVEKRFPAELSGGQRQRVAIARQLTKGAKVILADEPTGNLDSENGKIVFDLLKELSKDIVVIVASHDLEFARNYGDTIITLSDGKIINTEEIRMPETFAKPAREIAKNKFSNLYAFKLAGKNVLQRKIRFIIAILLSAVSMTMFVAFTTIFGLDCERTLAKAFFQSPPEHIFAFQSRQPEKNTIELPAESTILFPTETVAGLEEFKNVSYIPYVSLSGRFNLSIPLTLSNQRVAVIESYEDIESLGYEIYAGYLPLDGESVYITDYYANLIISLCSFGDGNGGKTLIPPNAGFSDLIGKTVYSNSSSNASIKINGVIKTDYERFSYENNAGGGYIDMGPGQKEDETFSLRGHYLDHIYNVLYANKDYIVRQNYIIQVPGQTSINGGGLREVGYGKQSNQDLRNVYILTDAEMIGGETTAFDLKKGETVISLDLYNKIFGKDYKPSHFIEREINYNEWDRPVATDSPKNFPSDIGSEITIDIYEHSDYYSPVSDYLMVEGATLKIAGICINSFEIETDTAMGMGIYLGDEDAHEIGRQTFLYDKLIITPTRSMKASEYYSLLKYLRSKQVFVANEYSEAVYNVEFIFYNVWQAMILFAGIMLVVSIIMFTNFIVVSINGKKKEIGIIRAMGGSGKSVFKIFFFEGLIFAAAATVLALAGGLILSIVLNSIYATGALKGLQVLTFSPMNLIYIPAVTFVSMIIASFLPIRKISKLSPAEAIRQL